MPPKPRGPSVRSARGDRSNEPGISAILARLNEDESPSKVYFRNLIATTRTDLVTDEDGALTTRTSPDEDATYTLADIEWVKTNYPGLLQASPALTSVMPFGGAAASASASAGRPAARTGGGGSVAASGGGGGSSVAASGGAAAPSLFAGYSLGGFGIQNASATGAGGQRAAEQQVGSVGLVGPLSAFGLEGDILRPTEVAAEANPPPGTLELPAPTRNGILSSLGITPENYMKAVTSINRILELDKAGYVQLALGAGVGVGTVALGAMDPLTLLAIVYYSPYALKLTGSITAKLPELTKYIYNKLRPILMQLYDLRKGKEVDTVFSYIIKGEDKLKISYEHLLSKLVIADEMKGVKDRYGNNDLWTAASAAQVANNSTITSAISLFTSYRRLAIAYPRPTGTDGASLVDAKVDADECNFIKNFFLFNYWLHKKYAARAQLRLFAGAIDELLLNQILTLPQRSFLSQLATLFRKPAPLSLNAANISRMSAGGSDFAGLINKEDWRIMNSVAANILANSGIAVCGDFISRMRTCMTVREVGAAVIRVAEGGEALYDDIVASLTTSAAPNRTGGGVNAEEALGRLTSRAIDRAALLQEQAEAEAEKRESEAAAAAAEGMLGGNVSFGPFNKALKAAQAAAGGATAATKTGFQGVGMGLGGGAALLVQAPFAPRAVGSALASGAGAVGRALLSGAQEVAVNPAVAGATGAFKKLGGKGAVNTLEQVFVPPFNLSSALQEGDVPGGSALTTSGGRQMNTSEDVAAALVVEEQARQAALVEQARQAALAQKPPATSSRHGPNIRRFFLTPSKVGKKTLPGGSNARGQPLPHGMSRINVSDALVASGVPQPAANAAVGIKPGAKEQGGGARRTHRFRHRKLRNRKTHKHRSTHKHKKSGRRVRFTHRR